MPEHEPTRTVSPAQCVRLRNPGRGGPALAAPRFLQPRFVRLTRPGNPAAGDLRLLRHRATGVPRGTRRVPVRPPRGRAGGAVPQPRRRLHRCDHGAGRRPDRALAVIGRRAPVRPLRPGGGGSALSSRCCIRMTRSSVGERLADVRAGLGGGANGDGRPALVEARLRDGFGALARDRVVHHRPAGRARGRRAGRPHPRRRRAQGDGAHPAPARLRRPAHRAGQPPPAHALRGGAALGRRAGGGRCSWSSWTASPASTTCADTTSATPCWSRWPGGCATAVGESDLPARLSGDEFAVVTEASPVQAYAPRHPAAHDARRADRPARRDRPPHRQHRPDRPRRRAPTATTCMRRADLALRRAKQLGRGRVEWYDEAVEEAIVRRMTPWSRSCPAPCCAGELDLIYQPILDLVADRPLAVEALLRWRHPRLRHAACRSTSSRSPRTLGLIDEIGSWVLRQACRQLADLAARGPRPVDGGQRLAAAAGRSGSRRRRGGRAGPLRSAGGPARDRGRRGRARHRHRRAPANSWASCARSACGPRWTISGPDRRR